jgi:hypothetical protein
MEIQAWKEVIAKYGFKSQNMYSISRPHHFGLITVSLPEIPQKVLLQLCMLMGTSSFLFGHFVSTSTHTTVSSYNIVSIMYTSHIKIYLLHLKHIFGM